MAFGNVYLVKEMSYRVNLVILFIVGLACVFVLTVESTKPAKVKKKFHVLHHNLFALSSS